PAGNAVAVWRRSNGTNTLARGATLASGSSTWVATSDISPLGFDISEATVAIDADGNAVAIFIINNGTSTVVLGATLASGSSTWVDTSSVSNPALPVTGSISLDADATGN